LLGFAAFMILPDLVTGTDDTQRVLPALILEATPVFVQVMFFGALLSAIMSTASGTLLAPSALFMENILRPALPEMSDRKALLLTRGSVVGFFIIIIGFVVYKYNQEEAQIFTMVENAYKITLA
jgi:SSS family solute:Na+ symporter